jgi:hypothetical protein
MKTAPLLTVVSSLLFATVCVASDTHEADRGIEGSLRATLPDKHVHVHVHHGIVTLDGQVRTSQERDRLEAIVRNTSGVVALKDDLKITSPSPGTSPEFPAGVPVVPVYTTPAPEVIPSTPVVTAPAPVIIPEHLKVKVQAWTIDDEPTANRIVRQLRIDGVPTTGLDHVQIMVRNGNVSLDGVVATQAVHDALIASLQRVGGANAIYDTLRVD